MRPGLSDRTSSRPALPLLSSRGHDQAIPAGCRSRREAASRPTGPASGRVQSSRPALTYIIGARRLRIVPMISSTIDPLQVDAGGRDVRMPELALDDRQWHPLAGELDSVRMPSADVARTWRRTPAGECVSAQFPRVRRSPTTAAHGSGHRSRKTARRPAARRGTRAMERGDRSTLTQPSRPHAAGYPSRP